jgi:hypothetical protein
MMLTELTFIETSVFSKLVRRYMSDDEYAHLQNAIAANPQADSVIPGSGGVRKLRWTLRGRGKRGGIRVIYFLRLRHGEVWMLTVYAKSALADIPGATLRKIKDGLDGKS